MPQYYDSLEAREPEERERLLMAALPGQVAHAKRKALGWARILADVDPAGVTSRAALAKLPVTRKSDLAELQRAERPFGGLNATLAQLGKVFVSPGPIYEPEGRGRDWWRTARALFAAGFRPGDLAINTFAYHFTPAGSMLESGALALGCTVVPTGTGQTEMQAATLADLRASAYIGTPSFLKLIVEKADELKADIRSLKKAAVGAEYLPPALRAAMAERGIRVLQSYASADLGLIAYESEALEGMILDEALILEIVRPGTGDPVPDGEVGEVVVTSFNPDYPLMRFGTGDLSAILPGQSPCGRTNTRIRGWMGRADQTTKVKGMFVHPSQVAEILKRHPAARRSGLRAARRAAERRQGDRGCEEIRLKPQVGTDAGAPQTPRRNPRPRSDASASGSDGDAAPRRSGCGRHQDRGHRRRRLRPRAGPHTGGHVGFLPAGQPQQARHPPRPETTARTGSFFAPCERHRRPRRGIPPWHHGEARHRLRRARRRESASGVLLDHRLRTGRPLRGPRRPRYQLHRLRRRRRPDRDRRGPCRPEFPDRRFARRGAHPGDGNSRRADRRKIVRARPACGRRHDRCRFCARDLSSSGISRAWKDAGPRLGHARRGAALLQRLPDAGRSLDGGGGARAKILGNAVRYTRLPRIERKAYRVRRGSKAGERTLGGGLCLAHTA